MLKQFWKNYFNKAATWDKPSYIKAGYSSKESLEARKSILGEILKKINVTGNILEVGAGWGDISIFLKEQTGEKIFSLDISFNALQEFKLKNKNDNIFLINADTCALPFKLKSISLLICIEMIQHLDLNDIENFVKEMERVIITRGIFIIIAPNPYCVDWIIKRIIIRIKRKKSEYFRLYSYVYLSTLLKKHNFEIKEVKNIVILPKLLRKFKFLSYLLQKVNFPLWGHSYLLVGRTKS